MTAETPQTPNEIVPLYHRFKEAKCEMGSWQSDLYVRATDEAKAIIKQFQDEGGLVNHSFFKSQIDGKLWIDVAFGYLPYWEQKQNSRNPDFVQMANPLGWDVHGTIGDYTVWHDGEIFQVTKGFVPGMSGYKNLEALLALKNLSPRDLVPADETTRNVRAIPGPAVSSMVSWGGLYRVDGEWHKAESDIGAIMYKTAEAARQGALACMEQALEKAPAPGM